MFLECIYIYRNHEYLFSLKLFKNEANNGHNLQPCNNEKYIYL